MSDEVSQDARVWMDIPSLSSHITIMKEVRKDKFYMYEPQWDTDVVPVSLLIGDVSW